MSNCPRRQLSTPPKVVKLTTPSTATASTVDAVARLPVGDAQQEVVDVGEEPPVVGGHVELHRVLLGADPQQHVGAWRDEEQHPVSRRVPGVRHAERGEVLLEQGLKLRLPQPAAEQAAGAVR